jgi:putative PIN family toxin of toxin-antitoxin system
VIRVVVDPGVFVSVLIGPRGSPPDRIFSAWVDDRLEIIASPRLIAELRGVVLRPRFRRWFDETSAWQLVARIERHATVRADPPQLKGTTRDPKDDYLVALAHAAEVNVIVSGDGDLHAAELTKPSVWTPRQLADHLASSSETEGFTQRT